MIIYYYLYKLYYNTFKYLMPQFDFNILNSQNLNIFSFCFSYLFYIKRILLLFFFYFKLSFKILFICYLYFLKKTFNIKKRIIFFYFNLLFFFSFLKKVFYVLIFKNKNMLLL